MWKQALVLFLFITCSSRASASFSFKIASIYPSNISDNSQEIQINLELQDLPSPSFFRVALQKESGDPYFGYIKNHLSNWVKVRSLSSDCRDYYLLGDTSTTSAILFLKVGESALEPGNYFVKAHRFTSTSCSPTEAINSQAISLAIPQVQTSPTLLAIVPTNTKVPFSTRTPPPTLVPSPTITQIIPTLFTSLTSHKPTSASQQVLSVQTQSITVTPVPTTTATPLSNKTSHWPALALIITGSIGLIGSLASLLVRHR